MIIDDNRLHCMSKSLNSQGNTQVRQQKILMALKVTALGDILFQMIQVFSLNWICSLKDVLNFAFSCDSAEMKGGKVSCQMSYSSCWSSTADAKNHQNSKLFGVSQLEIDHFWFNSAVSVVFSSQWYQNHLCLVK